VTRLVFLTKGEVSAEVKIGSGTGEPPAIGDLVTLSGGFAYIVRRRRWAYSEQDSDVLVYVFLVRDEPRARGPKQRPLKKTTGKKP